MQNSKRRFLLSILAVTFAITFAALYSPDVSAGQIGNWSPPSTISGLVNSGPSAYPVFMTDKDGNILVLNSQRVGDQFGIVISRWVRTVGWTHPVDVVMSPIGGARVMGGFIDNDDVAHLVFWGGDDTGANMYYSRAPRAMVDSAAGWTPPKQIGAAAYSPETAALVGDGAGYLLLVYGSLSLGNGLYVVQSLDGGQTWSNPSPMYLTGDRNLKPIELRMIYDSDGQVHAVWSNVITDGNSVAVYYAQLNAEHNRWSEAQVLATAVDYEAATPAILRASTGELFVIYHNDFPTTRWMRRSTDNGNHWTQAVRLFDQIGSNGATAMIEDPNGVIRIFFGNRIGDPATHGLWQSMWLGNHWSFPEAITAGPQVRVGSRGEEGFDPSFAQVLITNQNLLFVAWRHDPLAGPKYVWYSYQLLSPTQTLASIPTSHPESQPALISSPTPTNIPATATPQPTKFIPTNDASQETGIQSTNIPLFAGLIPLIILLGVIIILRQIIR